MADRITKLLTDSLEYRPGKTVLVELPREAAITEIQFIVEMWRGSKSRFSELMTRSEVDIVGPPENIKVLPSPNTRLEIIERNRAVITWHTGDDIKDPFICLKAIPAFLYSDLWLSWSFPEKPLGSKVNISIKLFEILPPSGRRLKRHG
jgi:hypothetical protein